MTSSLIIDFDRLSPADPQNPMLIIKAPLCHWATKILNPINPKPCKPQGHERALPARRTGRLGLSESRGQSRLVGLLGSPIFWWFVVQGSVP